MKKVIFLLAILWLGLSAFSKSVKADDYNTAVIGHIIQTKVNGGNVDTSVLEAELQKLTYNFATEMTFVLQKHLPNILEGIASEMRQNADKIYKCKLLEGGSYECKE
jgi:hypothetical protein|tara:strand:- start:1198 stop:1518 length:321 start_codon:yes stop_codon:yes gene_type:complete